MQTAGWISVPAFALLALAGTSVSARATLAPQEKSVGEKTKDGAEKATDAVVKGVTVATEKTKDGVKVAAEKTI